MAKIICVDCGTEVEGARQRRRCDPCRKARNSARTIRTLQRGEQVPAHEPSRYLREHGYVLLRWRIGTRSYVETYEHRVFNGRVTLEEEVHHINRNRSDNTPSNLKPTSSAAHRMEHAEVGWWDEAARLYREGLSTYQIAEHIPRHPATIWRALQRLDVPLRKEARIAIPNRERDGR